MIPCSGALMNQGACFIYTMFNRILFLFLTISSSLMSQDTHSFARPEACVITHAEFTFYIDFNQEIIRGNAEYTLKKAPGSSEVILDTRNLIIKEVSDTEGNKLTFKLLEDIRFLGSALVIQLPEKVTKISISYQTTSKSEALQWLKPEQTAGKMHPFLFTQGQAILTRTWIPVQDSPGIRFTWNAKVHLGDGLLPLMSGTNPVKLQQEGEYTFSMDQPVPAYLIALAAGNLEFRSVGKSTGVYAEPQTIASATYEFGDMQNMLSAAENLYGSYLWKRYDVIVLPPSFPFGGMENPMLTFATPTILAGDQSLTSLIAHELAHSWSGNLVTNKTWDDFWLNEGFTVYFERRIMESLYGKDYADMLAVLGYQDLLETIEDLGDKSDDTRLKLQLSGRDADDGMTDIAYEKGCLLLLQIEAMKGREAFDAFVNDYFSHFRFQSITTETFLQFASERLGLTADETAIVKKWIYEPGLPANHLKPSSVRLEKSYRLAQEFSQQKITIKDIETRGWSSHEWLYFIRNLGEQLDIGQCMQLDEQFGFTKSGNAEIQFAWFMKTIPLNYTAVDEVVKLFLRSVGRRKFVLPLFKLLAKNERLSKEAFELFEEVRSSYHSVTANSVEDALYPKK